MSTNIEETTIEETTAEEKTASAEDVIAADEIITEEQAVEAEAEAETETDEITQLQLQLEAAREEANKNFDGWQRAVAEMANYKKRQEEQIARRRAEITGNIINQLLPVIDDFDLAFQNVPEDLNEQTAGWVEGFKLVQRKLTKVLELNNVQPIVAEGEFDPNLHEAVTSEPSPDHEPNTIIAELRKGYIVGERVLRPALVRVAQ